MERPEARARFVTIVASDEGSQDERTCSPFLIVEPRRAELAEIAGQLDAGQVRPIVGGEFPPADAIVAYETKPFRGKVDLRVDDPE